jgi:hypothetical protein
MLTVLLIVFAFLVYMGFRNQQVFDYRMALIDKIHARNIADLEAGNYGDSSIRYRRLDKVSYSEMMLKFWIPVDAFIDEEELMELEETNEEV